MIITYQQPNLSMGMKDTLESYLSAAFPGANLSIGNGPEKFSITDIDDLRYIRRAKDVVVSLINLAQYVEENYS